MISVKVATVSSFQSAYTSVIRFHFTKKISLVVAIHYGLSTLKSHMRLSSLNSPSFNFLWHQSLISLKLHYNFIKMTLQHSYASVNFLHNPRSHFNVTSGRLLLTIIRRLLPVPNFLIPNFVQKISQVINKMKIQQQCA